MRELIQGIVDFRELHLPMLADRFRKLASGQSPDTLFITCADSRVVPNLLLSTDPGDLFTMRNVGNLIPPATTDGVSTGDLSEASAIEYAVSVLNVGSIVVCGHSGCGAMRAVLEPSTVAGSPNLRRWLYHADTAAFRLAQEGPLDASRPSHDQLSQLNVLSQLDHLATYPIVRDQVAKGLLKLIGWWFDIATGDMHAWRERDRRFVLIDRRFAESEAAESE
ncbi:carbonic anhydrase [Reyranella sp.]|uniref:carbonic anhydrase n=1 Tax=Reyranella sp. TaxID=1929291 RepID=UPI003D0EFDE0